MNHLQHGMSSQTFKAQMAISSWVGSDIFPTLEPFAQIIKKKSRCSTEKVEKASHSVKGKEKVVTMDSGDNTDCEWEGEIGYK